MKLKKLIVLCALLALSGCNSVQTDISGESSLPYISGTSEISEKTDITAAIIVNQLRSDSTIEEQIKQFNNSSEKYNINATVYMDDEDYYADSAFNRFSRDMVSGNSPDIIISSPEKAMVIKKGGYLTDIVPLMESYDGIKKSDFLDNVIESVEEDGEIRLIYNSFFLETAAAKTSIVGDTANWSFDEMSTEFDKLPKDENHDFLYNLLDDGTFRRYIMQKMTLDCINFENNTCNFSEIIPTVLDFIENAPTVGARYKTMQLPYDFENMLRDDRAVVNFFEINGINSSYVYRAYEPFHGEAFTFVGMPSNNNSGAYTTVNYMFGITETSLNKEGAWEFLNSLFDISYLTKKSLDYQGIPVTESAVKKLCDTSPYVNNSIRQSFDYPNSDEQFRLTDDEVNQLAEYIGTVRLEPYSNPQIEDIIKEECDAVFAGERTSEECAELLDNRIGLYLSEIS